MTTQFVILAAGMGTRLGKSRPKALTVLDNGETIMARQIRNIRSAFGKNAKITIVVGYKLEEIIEEFRYENFVYNAEYDMTNTSKSLLKALQSINKHDDVIWMNGDVVFDDDLLFYFKNTIEQKRKSTLVVNSDSVADEEVKYTVDANGYISALSKIVNTLKANGESVGINYVIAEDRPSLERNLSKVDNNDYFERAIEITIEKNSDIYLPFDITKLGLSATEVDFETDLIKANESIKL
jgi:choline kinase